MTTGYGPYQKIETLVPASSAYSRFASCGDSATPYGATFGGFSSDNYDGTCALISVGVHDSKGNSADCWPLYVEGWALKGSHPNGGIYPEVAMINQRGSCAEITPHDMSPAGQINALRLGVGKPGSNGGEISAFIAMLNVEGTKAAVAQLGIVIGDMAIKLINGVGRALNLARNHCIQWWSATGPTSMIVCDTADPASKITIRLGNGALHFEDANGQSQFSFNVKTGAFYMGMGGVGPNGTIRLWAAGQPYLIKATPEKSK